MPPTLGCKPFEIRLFRKNTSRFMPQEVRMSFKRIAKDGKSHDLTQMSQSSIPRSQADVRGRPY